MNKKLVYVDTDVGLGTPGAEIDDGAALIFLMRNRSIDIVGTGSVLGNVSLHDATLNLDRLLTWLDGEHVPMGLGAQKPLVADMTWFEGWQTGYGETLSWKCRPTSYLAANLIIDLVRAHPGQVSILSLGPMTNLALAIRLDQAIVSLAREVIVMGGSFNSQNSSPEFNVRCDPEAAQIVFSAGWNVHVLGLDITRRVHFSRGDFASLSDVNPAVAMLRAQAPGWIERVEEMGWEQDGCALHDAVAAAYLADEAIFQVETMSVEIELADPNLRGLTRFFPERETRSPVKVVTGLDLAECRDLIWSHLEG
jgi:inosine-uridine nucleoside N-ribohydrolase